MIFDLHQTVVIDQRLRFRSQCSHPAQHTSLITYISTVLLHDPNDYFQGGETNALRNGIVKAELAPLPVPCHRCNLHSMQTSLVITIIGPDRPGLVQSISKIVTENEGNWLQSRMAHLAGQFAGILQIEVAEEKSTDLKQALAKLEQDGLSISVATGQNSESPDPANSGPVLQLEVVGQDQPGIVRQISAVISAHGGNVEELNTKLTSAPWSGETLFQANALLRMPDDKSLDDFRSDLEAITQDLMVDLSLVQQVN